MLTPRERVGAMRDDDSGLSLVEVMVAMLIFAIISMGVVYALLSTLTDTSDSITREVAQNLAAQEIDSARATTDIFGLIDLDQPNYSFAGRVFHVKRDARWVSDPNLDAPCGAGGGALQYKRINITITWANMRTPSSPIRADTLIAPATRISDPSDATILVTTTNGLGQPLAGVTITTTPAITPAPAATDAQGCGYLLKVTPGTYTIKVSKSQYVDPNQNASPVQTITIGAGASLNPSFQLEQKQPLAFKYASNYAGTVAFPTNLDTSLLHASDPVLDSTGTPASMLLYPFAEGYTAMAGRYLASNTATAGCLSPNPASWLSGAVNGVNYASPTLTAIVPASGATASIAMGIVTVKGTANGQNVLAVSQATGPGTADPGCSALTMSYSFSKVLNSSTPTALALPFGTWQLYYGTTATAANKVPASAMTVTAPSSTLASTNTVTLDPRVVAP